MIDDAQTYPAQSELLKASLESVPDAAREHREAVGFLREQGALLEASLATEPDKARMQRKAIGLRGRQAFIHLVSSLNVPLVLQIGAHQAKFSKGVKKARPEARVVAFEAHPLVYARHASALQYAEVEYLQLCVADREGEIVLKVPKKIGDEESDKTGSICDRQAVFEYVEYPVKATTLDGFLGEAADLPNAMWIDVEGALAQVFAGGDRTLRNCRAMYVELDAGARWQGQLIDADVVSLLAGYGLKPALRDIQKKGFYNAVFVRMSNTSMAALNHDISGLKNSIKAGSSGPTGACSRHSSGA